MCTVSMIYDTSREHYWPHWPNQIPLKVPTKSEIELLEEAVELLKKIDEKLNQPNCEDPKKEEFFKALKKLAENFPNNKPSKGL